MSNRLPWWYLKDSDILILVVGQTGTGKSQFINTVAGESVMQVNDDLETSSDLRVQYTICTHPTHVRDSEPPFRIVFVDTPGLDGTSTEDFDIVQRISRWIDLRCHKDMDFAILYFIEANQTRLPLLDHLHAHSAIRDITLVVGTKFKSVGTTGPPRDKDHNGTHESAWNIVDHILDRDCAVRAFEVEEFFRTIKSKGRRFVILRKVFPFFK